MEVAKLLEGGDADCENSGTRQCVRGRRIGKLGTLDDEVSGWSTDRQ